MTERTTAILMLVGLLSGTLIGIFGLVLSVYIKTFHSDYFQLPGTTLFFTSASLALIYLFGEPLVQVLGQEIDRSREIKRWQRDPTSP
jgi:hypothetical protein